VLVKTRFNVKFEAESWLACNMCVWRLSWAVEGKVFHAGTAKDSEGHVVATGGRVLAVTAVGRDIAEAKLKAYEVCSALTLSASVYAHVSPCARVLQGACILHICSFSRLFCS
jgi:Phosphoribosylglycinamide synthetase, C domain